MRRILSFALLALFCSTVNAQRPDRVVSRAPALPQATQINHVFWIWFENEEDIAINSTTAPTFANFASTYANLTQFSGVSHPSQPNYLDAFSGGSQGVTDDGHYTFNSSVDNLAKQLAAAGKSWRMYQQDYPGGCSDVDTFTGGVDGAGLAGTYARKHNPAITFESVRLDATQCSFIQPLANFDQTVNFALIVPNLLNDMHDGANTQAKITQGDNFLNVFLPQITGSADWAHTLVIVTFDEGTTNTNGGGHIYTAAGAPWLSHATVSTAYNHFSVLRTTEQIFGLPFLGSAANATTINEILPGITTAAVVAVSGRVLDRNGIGIRNARVLLRGPDGNARVAIANALGYYRFEFVQSGGSYLLTADAKGLRFMPRAIEVNDQLAGVDLKSQ